MSKSNTQECIQRVLVPVKAQLRTVVMHGDLWIAKDLMDVTTAGDVLIQRMAVGQNGSLWSSQMQKRSPRSRLLDGLMVGGTRGRTSRSESGTLNNIIPKNHCVYQKLENLIEAQG